MERWGSASIFKESARLLHEHYRLFLPFYLAFYLPISIFSMFKTLFSSPSSSTPLPVNRLFEIYSYVNTTQTIDPLGGFSLNTIFTWILVAGLFLFLLSAVLFLFLLNAVLFLFLLSAVVGTLGTGAVFYITGYLYTPTRADDDRLTFLEVFRFLPHAFLRMFITQLWITLSVFVLFFFFISFSAGFLYVSTFTDASWSHPILFFFFAALFCLFLFLAASVYCSIVFALALVIAVLEPGNYGREALKRSTKLVRNGRVWTIVPVTLIGIVLFVVLSFLKNGIMTAGTPVRAKVVLGVVIAGLDAVFRVYSMVVSAVMYFVYKARFDVAAGSAGVPVLQRIDSAERLLDPIEEAGERFGHLRRRTLIDR